MEFHSHDQLQKRIKLSHPQSQHTTIHEFYDIQSQQQRSLRDNADTSTIRMNIETFQQIQLPLEAINLNLKQIIDALQNSYLYGQVIINQILNQEVLLTELISRLLNKSISLQKTLLIEFFNNVVPLNQSQNQQLYQLSCQSAQSLDREIRNAALKCLSKMTPNDPKQLVILLQKCKDSADLMESQGQKGLLVSALEDQYMVVRINAIRVIRQFILQSTEFSQAAQEILIYMLNDEMDSVRIETIQTLNAYRKIEFSKADSSAILFNLIEYNLKLRMQVYELIGQSIFPDRTVLLDIINSVCLNLLRFPGDFEMIGYTFKHLAKQNDTQLSLLELLNQKERLIQEPDWQNQEYILRMVYIRNSNSRDIKNEPFYFNRHFDYLGDKYPQFFDKQLIDQQILKASDLYERLKQYLEQIRQCNTLQISRNFIVKSALKLLIQIKAQYECQIDLEEITLLQFLVEDNCTLEQPFMQAIKDVTIPTDIASRFNYFQELKRNLKIKDFQQLSIVSRHFNFTKPIQDQIIKVNNESYLTIMIQGEFKNLKLPINKNYIIQIKYMDDQEQEFKIGRQDVEDNLITTSIRLSRIIIGFSQQLQIRLLEHNDMQKLLKQQTSIGQELKVLLQI